MSSMKRPDIPNEPMFEETRYSDGGIVTIIQCNPVQGDGSPDPDRDVEYRGETLANIGLPSPMTITFRIPEAKTLTEARSMYEKYLDLAAQEQMRLLSTQMAAMQKQKQQQIMTPDQMSPGMMSSVTKPKN